jgi:hypothetical protein
MAGGAVSSASLQLHPRLPMTILLPLLPMAAIGYSIIYMIFGGGLFGAVVIFVIAKIFRK